QTFKKNRLVNVNYRVPSNLHFVPMDFTKHFMLQNLTRENYMPYEKTFFSLLGVSYYLTKEEISNLMNELFTKVPSGSSIVFDYADDKLFEENGMSNRVQNMVQMATA